MDSIVKSVLKQFTERAEFGKEKYGVDGIMIGRAAIGNPWVFNQIKQFLKEGKFLNKPDIKVTLDTSHSLM